MFPLIFSCITYTIPIEEKKTWISKRTKSCKIHLNYSNRWIFRRIFEKLCIFTLLLFHGTKSYETINLSFFCAILLFSFRSTSHSLFLRVRAKTLNHERIIATNKQLDFSFLFVRSLFFLLRFCFLLDPCMFSIVLCMHLQWSRYIARPQQCDRMKCMCK